MLISPRFILICKAIVISFKKQVPISGTCHAFAHLIVRFYILAKKKISL